MRNPIVKMILEAQQPVRIYALNGMAITYANEIEDTMFWCYLAASGKSWEDAADAFYGDVKFSPKQRKTDAAVTARVTGTEHADAWKVLNVRIEGLLGQGNSIRNLIGHNAVSLNIYTVKGDSDRVPFTVLGFQEIRQKRAMVERRNRPEARVGDAELATYCEEVFTLYLDLEQFADEALQFGATHPQRCGLA